MIDADAATLLAAAYRSGERLQALPERLRPATIEAGYDIQDRLIACLETDVAGWKLGVGTTRAKQASGLGRAIAGRILADQVHAPAAVVGLPNHAPVTIEFEIAFVLARDISPSDAPFDPLLAVGETRVAFELVLSRFVDRRAVGWPSFAADNSAFQALVLGETVDRNDLARIADSLIVQVDGVDRASAATGDEATVAEESLADLFALARERGQTLTRGSIISTGSLSVPFDLAGTAQVRARYLDQELAFSFTRP